MPVVRRDDLDHGQGQLPRQFVLRFLVGVNRQVNDSILPGRNQHPDLRPGEPSHRFFPNQVHPGPIRATAGFETAPRLTFGGGRVTVTPMTGQVLGHTRWGRGSAPAVWVRSIARATRG